MSYKLVIRGGTIVDGTGAPARSGDVAVLDGRISEVGRVTARGHKEIDADGLVVAPGFIDPQTHYDAEEAVRRITSMPADVFGFADRGRLRPGLAADLVVFDAETIAAGEPELIHDPPNGGPRLVQRARGIAWSFVNDGAVIQDGQTPESPGSRGRGRVLRPAKA
jgi:N-acyl-D-aspartate/D-glutamate deacylase